MKTILNVETGEEIIRELTEDELKQQQIDEEIIKAKLKAKELEEAEIAKAKKSLLEKLGITEDEAKLLLS